jgi:transcriptional regulator with XRE-family HTH domain
MLYIAENLKNQRKNKDLTQEEAAEMLGVSAQSVSKWERGDTMPDVAMLPALANLYGVSVDALLGMDRINDRLSKNTVFTTGRNHLRNGETGAAAEVYTEALKTYPNDEGIMSELAMALALDGGPEKLSRAAELCERVLANGRDGKAHYSTRAALCFIYLKAGDGEKAKAEAGKLPHIRECRETVLAQFEGKPSTDEIDKYIKFIAIGEQNEQDIIGIDLGIEMIAVCTECDLIKKIEALRIELDAPMNRTGQRKLPVIRIRDDKDLAPRHIRLRHYADYLIDQEFGDPNEAVIKIIAALRKIIRDEPEKSPA